jgi:hypothetical protein
MTAVRKKHLSVLIVAIAVLGILLSSIGEMFSHGSSELSEPFALHDDQVHFHDSHTHDFDDDPELSYSHHDPSNHTHETAYQISLPLVMVEISTNRMAILFSGASPEQPSYRLERPPKPARNS